MALNDVPPWVADAVFYEVIPDRFAPPRDAALSDFAREAFEPWEGPVTSSRYRGGNLWGVVNRLDWLVELGVTALYLTPIHVSPTYHRYKPSDHLHVDPLVGGEAAFELLVREAHARDLRIVLDGVFNHVGIGFRGFLDVLEYGEGSPWRDWFHITAFPVRPFDPAGPTYRCWDDNPSMPKLNMGHPAVREHVLAVAEHWARRGIDGWRFDAASEMEVGPELWHEMRRRLRGVRDDFYLLGEQWMDPSPWLDGTQWDGATNFPFAFTCRELVGGARLDVRHRLAGQGSAEGVDAREAARRFEELLARHPWPHVLSQLNFVDNHDVARFRTAVGGDAARVALADLLLFAYPGAPCVYYGDEVGLEGGLPPDSRRGYPAPAHHDAGALARHRRLIALRRGSRALRRGAWQTLHTEGRCLVFARHTPDETALVALNAGEAPVEVVLATTAVPGRLEDTVDFTLGGFSAALRGDAVVLSLPPLSGGIVGLGASARRPTVAPAAREKPPRSATGPLDVVVVGNIGIDTNVYLPEGYGGPFLEGAFTDNLDGIGNAGGYSSFGFAALGVRTGFVGYVGDDPLGHFIETELERAAIERLLFVDPAGTSRSINLMRPDGRRNNFYDGKSHMMLAPDLDACRRFFAGARVAHVHLPNWARRLLPALRAQGTLVSCDLQDVVDLGDPYRADFIDAADVVFASAVNQTSPEALAEALLARRSELVVVLGMGAHGAGLATRATGFRHFPALDHPLPVVDSNGAGDSLAVGFLTAWALEGRPLEEAVRRGQIAARHACTLRGGWDRLITREALDRRHVELAATS